MKREQDTIKVIFDSFSMYYGINRNGTNIK